MVRLPPTGLLRSAAVSSYHEPYRPNLVKLVINFCPLLHSSHAVRSYLESSIIPLARNNPEVEVVLLPSLYRKPTVQGTYATGNISITPLKKMPLEDIQKTIQRILDNGGHKEEKYRGHPVKSSTPSVRGIWSGFHTV